MQSTQSTHGFRFNRPAAERSGQLYSEISHVFSEKTRRHIRTLYFLSSDQRSYKAEGRRLETLIGRCTEYHLLPAFGSSRCDSRRSKTTVRESESLRQLSSRFCNVRILQLLPFLRSFFVHLFLCRCMIVDFLFVLFELEDDLLLQLLGPLGLFLQRLLICSFLFPDFSDHIQDLCLVLQPLVGRGELWLERRNVLLDGCYNFPFPDDSLLPTRQCWFETR